MSGPDVLVTGATGFIGNHLTRRLVEEGHRVRCLVRARSDLKRLDGLRVDLVRGDLADPASLAGVADGCSHVFHCGALVSDWATVAEIRRVNVEGTRALLGAATDARVRRFVHVSSTDVYGYPGTRAVEESQVPAGFRNWYAQTKLEAEREVLRSRLEPVVLRPATVYGPGSREVIGEIAKALRGGHMLLIARGRPIAGLVYVENLVDLALLAMEHAAAPGEAFNATDGLDVTWRRLTDDLAAGLAARPARWSMPLPLAAAIGFALERGYRVLRRATGLTTPPLLSRQAVHVLGIDQDFSNAKARERLGWSPRVGYEDGLRATVRWLRDEYL